MSESPALSIVMPVFNEEDSIAQVVSDWVSELDSLGILYEFLVFDDGSRDNTKIVLRDLAAKVRALRVGHHENIGHGPTILRGYREARGDWVFQIDSDGEMATSGFRELWRRREDYDFLLGRRANRSAPAIRQLVTWVSRLSVIVLFGKGIQDANVPYRLMRGSLLREMTARLPHDLFAPNVILSGLAVRRGLRICELPVQHVGRQHGHSSLGRLTVLRPAARSLWQTFVVAWRARRGSELHEPRSQRVIR